MVQRQKNLDHRRQDGFTLIELLVVVAILGILAVAVTPKVLSSIRSANTNAAMTSATTLQLALERYATDNGDYPSQGVVTSYATLSTALASYVSLPSSATNNNWTFTSYANTASTSSTTGTYTLIIADKNQTPITISITPGQITHS